MYTVICGPDLTETDAHKVMILPKAETNLGVGATADKLVYFPEREYGAAGVCNLVRKIVAEYPSAVFVTRYSDVLSEIADMVADGKLPIEKFLIKLVRYDDDNGELYVTDHTMDSTGQYLVDWPYGVLDR